MDYMAKHGTPAYSPVGTRLRYAAGDLGSMNYMPVPEDGREMIYNGNKAFCPAMRPGDCHKVLRVLRKHVRWHCRITINAVFSGHL